MRTIRNYHGFKIAELSYTESLKYDGFNFIAYYGLFGEKDCQIIAKEDSLMCLLELINEYRSKPFNNN
jgi:hypothetical protein